MRCFVAPRRCALERVNRCIGPDEGPWWGGGDLLTRKGSVVRIGIWHWTEQAFNGEIVREEPRGGTETAVAYTCEALAAQGNEVAV